MTRAEQLGQVLCWLSGVLSDNDAVVDGAFGLGSEFVDPCSVEVHGTSGVIEREQFGEVAIRQWLFVSGEGDDVLMQWCASGKAEHGYGMDTAEADAVVVVDARTNAPR